ncbi:MAG: DNA-deoxyinosine glycosylase [Synergistes sp.]|nr:DNA-deoxyinosine glycosylase [Synergistes sp.]MCR5336494.1 DNA-deoxyinosine glycosylase [Synergistes sp.]
MKYSFAPVIDSGSRVLILGSLPGDRSIADARYYAHPRNAFWKTIYGFWGETPPESFDMRYEYILRRKLALWDVISHASRQGSSDGKIRDETFNDIPGLLASYRGISLILFNGAYAFLKYSRHFGTPAIPYRRLLSTSPACAGRDAERLKMWHEALALGLCDTETPRCIHGI